MKITAVFLDGEYDTSQIEYYRRHAQEAEYVIAADGGINFLNALDIVPDLLVGDGDGADFSSARSREVIQHSEDKDFTDGELAIREALKRRPENRINIYGGLRRAEEADHFYGNLGFLYLSNGIAVLRDPRQDIYLVLKDLKIEGHPGDLISLAPYGAMQVGNVKTEGLQWYVNDDISIGTGKYLRNKLSGRKAKISVGDSALLVFHGKKGDPLSYPI